MPSGGGRLALPPNGSWGGHSEGEQRPVMVWSWNYWCRPGGRRSLDEQVGEGVAHLLEQLGSHALHFQQICPLPDTAGRRRWRGPEHVDPLTAVIFRAVVAGRDAGRILNRRLAR